MDNHSEEAVTEAMLHQARSTSESQSSAPGYARPRVIGRHVLVRVVGETNEVVCFYKSCQVAGTKGDLSNFHHQPCQRRVGDDETRDDWGNVRP